MFFQQNWSADEGALYAMDDAYDVLKIAEIEQCLTIKENVISFSPPAEFQPALEIAVTFSIMSMAVILANYPKFQTPAWLGRSKVSFLRALRALFDAAPK